MPFAGVLGMLTRAPTMSWIARITFPFFPIRSGKYMGCTITLSSAKSALMVNSQWPFWVMSLTACFARASWFAGPSMVTDT